MAMQLSQSTTLGLIALLLWSPVVLTLDNGQALTPPSKPA